MQYPLSSAHLLIYETIHPKVIVNQTEFLQMPCSTWEQYRYEVKTVRLSMINQFMQAGGTDALRANVHTCQAGCINLINRLGYYITLTQQIIKPNETRQLLIFQYHELQRVLLSHLSYLSKHYPLFFDLQQEIPSAMRPYFQDTFQSELEKIKLNLLQTLTDPELITLAFSLLDFSSLFPLTAINYRQLFYYESFLKELQLHYHETIVGTSRCVPFVDFLIRKNFNHPLFMEYITNNIRKQIAEDMTPEEQADKWAYHAREFNLLTSSTALYSEYPAIKDYLMNTCEQELNYLQRRIKSEGSLHTQQPLQKVKGSIVTALTISQLGVFVRALTDANIIQYENQTELLRMIASCVKTTKMNPISPEGLRVRYYNPDKASVTITKEYLMQMLSQLKKY